ncbi:myocardin-related transcription factor B isoform X2 [Paramormyrops kingsleyae]|uniref:myocardin-related transcription factor B isoform X2 n=1 Tax=Paramormyrops kingsleyae TaxID=1676925 RepID=UPI000CD5CC5B|nr:MKL/myocardin-like protein 2 isoform X2 [Paramormyrops kingsleyae]
MEPQSMLVEPSPRYEAMTHHLEELSLQPNCSLPPLDQRRNALQLQLQQRRTRQQLADQGIMPPLKSPAVFHERIRSLERARTENFLKQKIRSRPQRSELVRMHILQETAAEPSLQAAQMKLKRARLADDLNEKIAQRPGPMELVEKNILPVDCNVKEAISGGEVGYPQTHDVYTFDEDSGDIPSPERPASQESQGSSASPPAPRPGETPPTAPAQLCPAVSQPTPDLPKPPPPSSSSEQPAGHVTTSPQKPGPTLVKQSQPKLPSDKTRSKKGREARPRVKKFKYHQYMPPEQRAAPGQPAMDSCYSRLLQQQQLFLQLQILSQQQCSGYRAALPADPGPAADGQKSPGVVALPSNGLSAPLLVSLPTATPPHSNHAATSHKPGPLPAKLDDMKVAELKCELKLRGLPVSGTKVDLIERLRPYQEKSSAPDTMDTLQGAAESASLTSPGSPGAGAEETESARGSPMGEDPGPSERDQQLHEKERQIEELMRQLEREQRLVEELKMQLEVEKRHQQGEPRMPSPVKEEGGVSPSCNPIHMAAHKQEKPLAPPGQDQVPMLPQFLLSHQPGASILLPVSLPARSTGPQPQPSLQAAVSTSAPGLIQASIPPMQLQDTEALAAQPHSEVHYMAQTLPASSAPTFQYTHSGQAVTEVPQCFLQSPPDRQPSPGRPPSQALHNGLAKQPPSQPTYILQPTAFTSHAPKIKDPPRYEEAVKQTRGLQASTQVSMATSQQMDDLFDVLIESGEMSPFTRQDPPAPAKTLTACVTTLPVGMVLSRPPPQVHEAPPSCRQPALAPSLPLMDELDHQLLEPPLSPMDTSSLCLPPPSFDGMDWMDLPLVGPLGATPAGGIFSSDIDTHDLQLQWD